jgi:hypothetical protein
VNYLLILALNHGLPNLSLPNSRGPMAWFSAPLSTRFYYHLEESVWKRGKGSFGTKEVGGIGEEREVTVAQSCVPGLQPFCLLWALQNLSPEAHLPPPATPLQGWSGLSPELCPSLLCRSS